MRNRVFLTLANVVLCAGAEAASVDGVELYSTASGEGPAIVLVHGWTCDTTVWEEQIADLAADYQVIAIDLPGHGGSGMPADGTYSMPLFARAVEAVRAQYGVDEFVLAGHSMGVPVIRQYALDFPDRVAGLIAVDGPLLLADTPPLALPEMSREELVLSMFVDATPDDVREQVLALMLGTPDARAGAIGASMADPAIRTSAVIDAPVISIVAGNAAMPDAALYGDAFPDIAFEQMPETGHFLMMEQPGAFNRLVRDFLERIDF